MAEAAPQEPALMVEPMEEDGPGEEGPQAEGTMGSTGGETMDIMDGVDTMIQESTFINDMLEEMVPTSAAQEMWDTGGRVTQEPPPNCLASEIVEELNPEVDTIPQEPMSTVG